MELATLRLGSPGKGPHVLISGGVHGDEFEPMAAIRRLATLLADQEIRGEITLIPVVNESAFELGQRVGSDGLDLARTCPGRPDGSPTEQAAHALSGWIRRADAYIDLHTGGARLSVQPMTGYMLHASPEVLDRQREMAKVFGLPIIWGTDPSLPGRSLSVARDANVPAIYAEYLGGGGCLPDGVQAYVQGCLNVLASLGLVDSSLADAPSSDLRVFEDSREGSGHMQVQHPSPCDGLFEAAVSLGQAVRKGEPLGTVSDLLGREVVTVPCDHSGLVLVLRCFARVSAGESLGVVLET